MNNKKSTKEKYGAWIMSADMYLASSFILLDELKKSYRSPILRMNSIQRIGKKCGFTSTNHDCEIFLPAIFNLKHGVELYLKALIMQLNSKIEYPITHDIVELLNKLIVEVRNKDKKDDKINLLDKDVRKIIEKYYFGNYAFSDTKSQNDKNNEAERFPEYQYDNCYEVKDLYNLDFFNLIPIIKKDCVDLQKYFREDILKKIF